MDFFFNDFILNGLTLYDYRLRLYDAGLMHLWESTISLGSLAKVYSVIDSGKMMMHHSLIVSSSSSTSNNLVLATSNNFSLLKLILSTQFTFTNNWFIW
jgi:hypothetical protein